MGFPPQALVWTLIGAFALATAVCLAAAVFAWRSAWPIGVRRVARDVSERLDALEIEWRKVRGELAADVEALEQLEESVERKRRRAAASASATRPANGEVPTSQMSRDQLRDLARARGFRV